MFDIESMFLFVYFYNIACNGLLYRFSPLNMY